MKKKLITLNNIEEFIEDKKFTVSKEMILQPSVKDYLKNRGISIIYSDENILKKAEEILKNEFKIKNNEVIIDVIERLKGVLKNEY